MLFVWTTISESHREQGLQALETQSIRVVQLTAFQEQRRPWVIFCLAFQKRTVDVPAADPAVVARLRSTFEKISGADMEVDAYELKEILNAAYKRGGYMPSLLSSMPSTQCVIMKLSVQRTWARHCYIVSRLYKVCLLFCCWLVVIFAKAVSIWNCVCYVCL